MGVDLDEDDTVWEVHAAPKPAIKEPLGADSEVDQVVGIVVLATDGWVGYVLPRRARRALIASLTHLLL